MPLPPSIHVVTHPLVQHKLTKMRDKETSSANFRRLLREIGLLLGYDATRDLPLVKTHIETPVAGWPLTVKTLGLGVFTASLKLMTYSAGFEAMMSPVAGVLLRTAKPVLICWK